MIPKETQEKIDRAKKQAEERKKNYVQNTIKRFQEMEPFDGDVDRIPLIPVLDDETYQKYIVPNLIRCGAIPKEELEVGATYLGDCRNAHEAVWNGEVFVYKRTKFGYTYDEEINHFQDDDGYDVYTPIKKIEDDV